MNFTSVRLGMKSLILSFLLEIIPIIICAQTREIDSLKYVETFDKFGNKKKTVVVKAHEVLIVDGDSIYTVANCDQLREIVEGRKGFDIINNRDSISLFLRSRIKSMMILKEKKEP